MTSSINMILPICTKCMEKNLTKNELLYKKEEVLKKLKEVKNLVKNKKLEKVKEIFKNFIDTYLQIRMNSFNKKFLVIKPNINIINNIDSIINYSIKDKIGSRIIDYLNIIINIVYI